MMVLRIRVTLCCCVILMMRTDVIFSTVYMQYCNPNSKSSFSIILQAMLECIQAAERFQYLPFLVKNLLSRVICLSLQLFVYNFFDRIVCICYLPLAVCNYVLNVMIEGCCVFPCSPWHCFVTWDRFYRNLKRLIHCF